MVRTIYAYIYTCEERYQVNLEVRKSRSKVCTTRLNKNTWYGWPTLPSVPHKCSCLPHLTGTREPQSFLLDSHTILLLQPLPDRRSRTFLDFETVGKAVDGGISEPCRAADTPDLRLMKCCVRCRCVWPV